MKVGILGTGVVGHSLGRGFITLGHEVKMGSRRATNEKALAWAKEMGARASAGTFADAADFGEMLVLATPGVAVESALQATGRELVRGKIVIDATNPVDFSKGPSLAVTGRDSAGERAQKLLPDAFVVKAFNTVGHANFFRPSLAGGPPDMFICGNSDDAKERVATIVADFGWGVIDLGGIESSRYMEAAALIWIIHALRTNSWTHAFKFLSTEHSG